MDYKEEQLQELEVLQSIYPDELQIANDEYPAISFTLSVDLDLQDLVPGLTRLHGLLLHFKLPENYPDSKPEIAVEPIDNTEAPESDSDSESDKEEYDEFGNKMTRSHKNLADSIELLPHVPDALARIDTAIDQDMLLGMQMCFQLISMIKEDFGSYVQKSYESLEQARALEIEAHEKQEQAKFHGTPVTKESFQEWRQRFRKEMKYDERDRKRYDDIHGGRPTGRKMFETGMANDDSDELLADSMESMKI